MNTPIMLLKVRHAGSVGVIVISGEVTAAAERELMEAFAQACEGPSVHILLNFEKLHFINSSGIGLLVTLLIRARRQQVRLMACGLSQHYRQIFELTRLNEAIAVFNTEMDALAALHLSAA